MQYIKLTNDFYLDEFICPEVYNQWLEKSQWFIKKEIVTIAQFIRGRFGKPMTINNWASKGQFDERGLRLPNSTTGAAFSIHKFGGAFDFDVEGKTAEEVREDIRINWKLLYMPLGLTTIEKDVNWVHVDTRWTGMSILYEVPIPKK